MTRQSVGENGRYYIVYFGWQKPGEWKVDLPRGIADGAGAG